MTSSESKITEWHGVAFMKNQLDQMKTKTVRSARNCPCLWMSSISYPSTQDKVLGLDVEDCGIN